MPVTTTNINAVDQVIGIGGEPIADVYNRIVGTYWGPSTTVSSVGVGFCAVSLRCINDGVDENVNGGLLVAHDTDYTATAGYAHTFQVYAAGGMEGLVLGSNTPNSYIRGEIGPLWPDSEVWRIRGTGANVADHIFNWHEYRTVIASQSGTTITATVGTFSAADVTRWACWNEYLSNKKESNAFRIIEYISPTQVTVDTSRTVPSQACRISMPQVHINSLGCIGINGPAQADARFPIVAYGPKDSLSYAAFIFTTEQDISNGIGLYQYDPVYSLASGYKGSSQIAALPGSLAFVITSYDTTADFRIDIGTAYPNSNVLRVKYRSSNSADFFFNWNVVRTHTANQAATTVTATVGSFVASDKGRYVMFAGAPGSGADYYVFKITAYISPTQVIVDTSMVGGIVSQTMLVCSPKAFIDSNGTFKSTVPTGAADPTADNFEAGTGGLWKNTSSGETRYWFNDAGTLKKSAAFT